MLLGQGDKLIAVKILRCKVRRFTRDAICISNVIKQAWGSKRRINRNDSFLFANPTNNII